MRAISAFNTSVLSPEADAAPQDAPCLWSGSSAQFDTSVAAAAADVDVQRVTKRNAAGVVRSPLARFPVILGNMLLKVTQLQHKLKTPTARHLSAIFRHRAPTARG